jgi:hypothetical protein
MKTPTLALLLATSTALASFTAGAHHSYAMFDGSREQVLQGTVARFEWRNPHVFLWLHVPRQDAAGQDLYGLESDVVNELRQLGWSGASMKAGDRVKVTLYPLRDGRKGGHLVSVTLPDGTTLRGAAGPINALRASGGAPAGAAGALP